MCGIVGYTGPREAGPILIEGLKRLEYRGYDSAGIALVDDAGALFLEKRAGKLANLQTAIADRTPHAAIGLAHTRWATHGRPNDLNAHPHQDCTGEITVIHNGIIENFRELRDGLEARGHTLASETDTEAIAHLIEEAYAGDLADAVRAALRRLWWVWPTARASSPRTSPRSWPTRTRSCSSRRATSPTCGRGASRSPASTASREIVR
jgi:glucosamine--fructose-6-phosphate aminotransferase (isomerizing)